MKEKKILLNKLLKQSNTNFLDCSSYKEAIAILKNGIKAKYFLINGNPLTISIMINNTKQSFMDENVIFLTLTEDGWIHKLPNKYSKINKRLNSKENIKQVHTIKQAIIVINNYINKI